MDKDNDIRFPHFSVLKASAGSGKTYELTLRFVQFILSEKIPRNQLRNILAITFSNNAAKEMKARVLLAQGACLGEPEAMEALLQVVDLDADKLKEKAGMLISLILDNFSDFQMKTIDSFMTTVFKSSAIDFGYNPDFEILMDNRQVMEYSFNLFLRGVRTGTTEAALFEEVIDFILGNKKSDASFLWDPSKTILEELIKIYSKLASTGKAPKIEEYSQEMARLKPIISEVFETIEAQILKSGLTRRGNSSYSAILSMVKGGQLADVIGRGLKNPPVNKPKKGFENYDQILELWQQAGDLINRYTLCYVRSFYAPYLKIYKSFIKVLEESKRRQGKVFIEDINKDLAGYLENSLVPDVYFRLGEIIFHFLIDEFQDTSPVQWLNLFPLTENSLSQGGSLFVVGDTKQAIYGFRSADYTIMKRVEKTNPFPSAHHAVQNLDTNYRSAEKILDFNKAFFQGKVSDHPDYREAAIRSGLSDYVQKVQEGREGSGYVEVGLLDKEEDSLPEKDKLQSLISSLLQRGYLYRDITVLTQKNEDAVKVTSWLNEKNVPFISYSSLDIRRRKITGEIVSLLNFLDSPTDDLSFATFLLGDIFMRRLRGEGAEFNREQARLFLFRHRDDLPLYKAFQLEFPKLWDDYLSTLFRNAGYYPLYDMVTEIFSLFRVFETMQDEEATLVKILETVKDFEGAGYNSLGDFLSSADDLEKGISGWDMKVPKGINAVKVMTIHKSKGLGFPVVILLLYSEAGKGFDYIVDEQAETVSLLKITDKTLSCDPAIEALYREKQIRDRVNRLNSLYVGMTRAEEELYVVGVKGQRETYPFNLLLADDYPETEKPPRHQEEERAPEMLLSLVHHRHEGIPYVPVTDHMINAEERRRGEFIHKVLSSLEYLDEGLGNTLAKIIRRVNLVSGEGFREEELIATLMDLLEHKEIARYFTSAPGRVVRREQDIVDKTGNLFRVDRLVIDTDKVTVIDFKTGREGPAELKHTAQIRTYLNILEEVYSSKELEGILIYVDHGEIRRVR